MAGAAGTALGDAPPGAGAAGGAVQIAGSDGDGETAGAELGGEVVVVGGSGGRSGGEVVDGGVVVVVVVVGIVGSGPSAVCASAGAPRPIARASASAVVSNPTARRVQK